MISLIKVMVVGGRKNADFCEYRNKNGSYRRNYFICKKHDIHCVAVMEDDEEILEIHGFAEGATDSPKMILKTAYKAGMIKDEELWLSALQERNNVIHSYNRKIAMGIITQAKQKFYKMFCELKEEIDRNWI